ncbi:MAG: archaellin/type IV pilin N-terminal domain-containing protein [Thermoplasmataceae archaeon]
MKQIINKEDKAVSPIIATILLIAITVVLAATLYTVLGGFTKGLSSGSPTASISFTEAGTTPNYTISFNSVSTTGITMTSLSLEIFNGSISESVTLPSSGTVESFSPGASLSHYNTTVSGASSNGDLTTSTIISISGNSGTPNGAGTHHNNTITSITIHDTSTNTTLVSNTVAPSLIVAQTTFKFD